MDLGISGKRALVLGASKGLGRGVAHALAAEGAVVGVIARNGERLAATAREIEAATGSRVAAFPAEIGDEVSARAAVTSIIDRIGDIDILVNNTGGPPPTGAVGIDPAVWREQFSRMVMSLVGVTEQVLPSMRARRWGRILTIASTSVIEPHPMIALSNSLRSTLVGWSKTLAAEIAPDGVTVNVLLPGSIATDRLLELDMAFARAHQVTVEEAAATNIARIPARRYGTVAEFGATAAFLVSEQAAYITGSMIRVDGGAVRNV